MRVTVSRVSGEQNVASHLGGAALTCPSGELCEACRLALWLGHCPGKHWVSYLCAQKEREPGRLRKAPLRDPSSQAPPSPLPLSSLLAPWDLRTAPVPWAPLLHVDCKGGFLKSSDTQPCPRVCGSSADQGPAPRPVACRPPSGSPHVPSPHPTPVGVKIAGRGPFFKICLF